MFVFKAAVVGAGTMGGEIAQVIASADIPVVLKDVDQKFIDQGLEKAKQVTEGQLGRLVKKEKLTQEQADAQAAEILGRIHGTTEYEGFGDVDFVVEAVPEKMEIKQAVFGELDALTPGHAILASNTSSLSISEMGDSRPPGQGRRLPLLLPGLDDAPDRGHRGRRHVSGDHAGGRATSPRRSARCRSAAPSAPASWATASPTRRSPRSGGCRRRAAPLEEIDKALTDAKALPMGPFFLADQLGLDTVFKVAQHLQESYGDRFYVHKGMEELVGERQPRRQDREGVL